MAAITRLPIGSPARLQLPDGSEHADPRIRATLWLPVILVALVVRLAVVAINARQRAEEWVERGQCKKMLLSF